MPITLRDIDILNFINDFGYCNINHISKRFGFNYPRNYEVMRKLIKEGTVIHEFILKYQHGIYRLTNQGAKLTDFPPIKTVNLAHYHHHLIATDLVISLWQKYPDASLFTERQLKRDQLEGGKRRPGHLPDAVLQMPDGKNIAIEVELTPKWKKRFEKIIKGYAASFYYKEVWYFCPTQLMARLKILIGNMDFIKLYDLKDDCLNHQDHQEHHAFSLAIPSNPGEAA